MPSFLFFWALTVLFFNHMKNVMLFPISFWIPRFLIKNPVIYLFVCLFIAYSVFCLSPLSSFFFFFFPVSLAFRSLTVMGTGMDILGLIPFCSVSFLNLQIFVFFQIWLFLSLYFFGHLFRNTFFSLSFQDSDDMHHRYFIMIPQVTEDLFSFHQPIFFLAQTG